MSLLDELKKQAEAKQSQDQIDKQRQAELEAISRDAVLPKLVQIYTYLQELLKQVDILQADVRADYNLKGCGNLIGLRQEAYEIRSDSRDNMTNLTLGFYCVGEGEIKFELDTQQQVEQQKDYFKQHDLAFTSRDYRDERHNISHALFTFAPRIQVAFDFQLAKDLAMITLTVRNYEGLGIHRYQLEPSRIDDDFLDELGRYILRRENTFLKLDISENYRQGLRQKLANEEGKEQKNTAFKKQSNVTYLNIKRKEVPASIAELELKPEPDKELDQLSAAMQEITEPERPVIEEKKVSVNVDEYTQFANLPSPIKELKRSELDKVDYVDRLEQLHNFPDKLFQTATQFFSSFNRSIIKPNKRLELVSAIIGQVYPVLAETIEKYRQQKYSLPENHVRRETLLAATSMVEQFSIAYKHVFKVDVTEAVAKNYERMSMCAFRIMELIRIEQRLRALRYQNLPAGTWEDCNKVFFYLFDHADIEKEFKLLGTASRWVKSKGAASHRLPSCSIKKLYFSIQLFGVLDITTWPVWLFQVSDQYLEFVDDALCIIPDHGQEVAAGWLITAINYNRAASFKRLEVMRSPSIIIDYSNLYNYLVVEHESLTKKRMLDDYDESQLSEPLKNIHKYDRIPVLETILLSLRERERHNKRHAAIDSESFRIYFGFDESYRLLSDMAQTDKKQLREMRDFIDTLAGKSSMVLDDQQTSMRGWEMINFSTGGLLLGTEESDFTSPIEMGQVVAFTPSNQEKQPLLGCVTRVQRSRYRNVEIAIFRLSTHAEAALVIQTGKDSTKGLPVILMRDMDEKWKILVPNQYNFVSGTPLQIIRADGKRIPARLGGLWLVKNKFTIHDLSSPKLS